VGADPISLGALALGAIGTGINAFSQYQAGQSQQQASEFNAQLAELAGKDALSRGEEQASRIRGDTDRLIGAQRAGYAAAGVALDEGSPLDVMVGSRRLSEEDIRTTRLNAGREAWGYKSQAEQFRRQGADAANAGLFGAIGTGISGATQTLLGTNDLLKRLGILGKKGG